jgi:hypothetical protein
VHCCHSHLHCTVTSALTTTERKLPPTAPSDVRADPPSAQQVHSKVSLRRAVNAV